MEKWGIWGLKRSKSMVLIGNKAMGGFSLVKAPEEKWGEMGKLGENGKKWGANGDMGKVWGYD